MFETMVGVELLEGYKRAPKKTDFTVSTEECKVYCYEILFFFFKILEQRPLKERNPIPIL